MKNAMRLSVLIVLFLVCFISSVFAIGNTGNNQEKVVVRAESTDNRLNNQEGKVIVGLVKVKNGVSVVDIKKPVPSPAPTQVVATSANAKSDESYKVDIKKPVPSPAPTQVVATSANAKSDESYKVDIKKPVPSPAPTQVVATSANAKSDESYKVDIKKP